MIRLRTSELARAAKDAGFTPTETHRAMLDGAAKLLKFLATNPDHLGPAWSTEDRALVEQFAHGLDVLNMKISFIDLGDNP